MYTVRMHVIKLLFVFILQTCSLLERGPSQEPRRVEGKLFILPTSAVTASSEWPWTPPSQLQYHREGKGTV